jgi:hypothetical protein
MQRFNFYEGGTQAIGVAPFFDATQQGQSQEMALKVMPQSC